MFKNSRKFSSAHLTADPRTDCCPIALNLSVNSTYLFCKISAEIVKRKLSQYKERNVIFDRREVGAVRLEALLETLTNTQ